MARETLKLSLKGKEMVNHAWQEAKRAGEGPKTQGQWAISAYVALPTLKRFVKGEAILKDGFKNLCEQIGVNWEEVIDSQCPNPQKITISPSTALSNTFDTPQGSFMLVGIFTDKIEANVKIAFCSLVQILQKGDVKPDFIFDGEQRTVSIIGTLPSQGRAKAELFLNHLKKLLDYEMTFLD